MAKWKQDSSGKWKKNSSSKKNYTIVNGRKVEQSASSTKTAPATSNDTWNNDTVSLEEAKQQTKDIERGIINLDTGATSIADTPKTTVSLTEASTVSSSESANRVLASESTNSLLGGTVTESYIIDGDKVTKTTETVELHNDLSTIKVGGPIKSAAQLGTVTKKKTVTRSWSNPFYTKPVDLSNVPDTKQESTKTLTGEQADRIKTLLGTENKPSGTGQEGTISQKPGATAKLSATTELMNTVIGGVKYGLDSEKNPITVKTFSADDYGIGYGIYKKGLPIAEGIRGKGSKVVGTGIDAIVAANKYNPLSIVPDSALESGASTAKKFITGAVVNTGAGLVQGASAAPMALQVAVKEPKALGGALIFGTGVMAGATVKGLRDDPATTLGELTGAILVGKTAEAGIRQFPVKKASLTEIKGTGSSPGYEKLNYGTQLQINGNPILSYSKEAGLTRGPLAAPSEMLAGKKVTAFGKQQTANFMETLNKLSPDAEYFKAGRSITDSIYRTKQPVKKPTEFKITSENIPESAKPVVEQAIKSYKGNAEVYGSVAQKMQVQEYMSRKPADLEVSVSDANAFVSHLKSTLDEGGVKYRIKGEGTDSPKVEFFDRAGKPVKGIEIFKKGKLGEGSGYTPEADIAYGFNKHRSIKVDKVKVMDLREQAPRKLSGAMTLQGKLIEPVHAGRLKDVGDLLETSVGHAIEKNPGISLDVLKFNELARTKYPALDELPVSKFMSREGRVPTKSEFTKLVGDKKSKTLSSERELLYSSSGKKASSPLSRVPALGVSLPSFASSKPSKSPSRPSRVPASSSVPKSLKSMVSSVPRSISGLSKGSGRSKGKGSSGQSSPSSSGRSGSTWSTPSGSESIGKSISVSVARFNKRGYVEPIVPITAKLKGQGRRKKSGSYGVDRKIAENKFKNIWELV